MDGRAQDAHEGLDPGVWVHVGQVGFHDVTGSQPEDTEIQDCCMHHVSDRRLVMNKQGNKPVPKQDPEGVCCSCVLLAPSTCVLTFTVVSVVMAQLIFLFSFL